MASKILPEQPQFNALGGFDLGFVENGVYREVFTPYISERQRDIVESRAWERSQKK